MGYQYLDVPITALEERLGLAPLDLRREVADLSFLYKLMNGAIDCPELLSLLEFRVPTGTRSLAVFVHRSRPTNYLQHAAIPRIMRLGNVIAPHVDFFRGMSNSSFKTLVRKILIDLNKQ